MPEFSLGLPLWAVVTLLVVTVPLSFLLTVVLFRAGCDLCSVEPPGFLKSCLVVLAVGVVLSPISAGIVFGFRLVGEALKAPVLNAQVLGSLAAIPILALFAGLLYIPTLRVGYLKGVLIYLVQSLLGTLVGSVIALVVVGLVVFFQGVARFV